MSTPPSCYCCDNRPPGYIKMSEITMGGIMPFIESKERRKQLDRIIDQMVLQGIKADGDLNYVLYKFCKYHVAERYNVLKNFLGELRECENQCRNDFLVPYEEEKKKENGDV